MPVRKENILMVILYGGTPGSGKSYHSTLVVHLATKKKVNIIANFVVNLSDKQKKYFYYKPTEKITVDYLKKFAMEHHANEYGMITKESQTILIIDEASIIFNCRDSGGSERNEWLKFFSQHRKLGYDVILITQMDRSLDRQIRGVIEYYYIHRKLTNYGLRGWFLRILLMKSFVCIHQWYPVKERIGAEYFGIKKKIANSYDTFSMFSIEEDSENVQLPSETAKQKPPPKTSFDFTKVSEFVRKRGDVNDKKNID